ncbi:MAG: DUF4115 domain-containing protein [Dehalococcoidia bacterium]
MAAPTRDEADRYALSRGGTVPFSRARLFEAQDRRLGRPLRAWVLDEPPASEGRHRLHELARDASRLTDSAYLRVVDALDEPERLVVLVDAPAEGASRAQAEGESALVDRVRALASALREASRWGLELRRLPPRALLDGALQLDPIEVFLGDGPPPSPRAIITRALTEASTALDLADAHPLAALARAWSEPSRATGIERLSDLPGQLERATGGVAPVDHAWLRAGDDAGTAFSSTDPTLRLDLPPSPLPSDDERHVDVRPRLVVRRRPSRIDAHRVLLGAIALGVSVLVLGGLSVMVLGQRAAAPPSAGTPVASEQGPPQPLAGQVLVIVRAQEESFVRATVDGTVLFDGTMRSGETKSWQGRQRVQVYTNKGRSMNITINGTDLGPYSPAMGHPDWNQIDFGFGPDWRP